MSTKRKRQIRTMPEPIEASPEDVAKSLFSTPPMTQKELEKRIRQRELEETKESSENA